MTTIFKKKKKGTPALSVEKDAKNISDCYLLLKNIFS